MKQKILEILNNNRKTTDITFQGDVKSPFLRDYQFDEVTNDILNVLNNNFPSNKEIWEWWKTQKFQKEQGEQEYTMIYEIDLPKILKAFVQHMLK